MNEPSPLQGPICAMPTCDKYIGLSDPLPRIWSTFEPICGECAASLDGQSH